MFKVGDRVINVIEAERYENVQWTGTVTEIINERSVRIKADEGGDWRDSVEEGLVLLEIYESPLYKTMRENDV